MLKNFPKIFESKFQLFLSVKNVCARILLVFSTKKKPIPHRVFVNGLRLNGGVLYRSSGKNAISGDFLTFSKKYFVRVHLFYFHNFLAKKNSNTSNFNFLFWHCIGIIENNISTKFSDNQANFVKIITMSWFQCFLYSSGYIERDTSIFGTLFCI